jgi:hypothetical protein
VAMGQTCFPVIGQPCIAHVDYGLVGGWGRRRDGALLQKQAITPHFSELIQRLRKSLGKLDAGLFVNEAQIPRGKPPGRFGDLSDSYSCQGGSGPASPSCCRLEPATPFFF